MSVLYSISIFGLNDIYISNYFVKVFEFLGWFLHEGIFMGYGWLSCRGMADRFLGCFWIGIHLSMKSCLKICIYRIIIYLWYFDKADYSQLLKTNTLWGLDEVDNFYVYFINCWWFPTIYFWCCSSWYVDKIW
jgi:hypothetical protein